MTMNIQKKSTLLVLGLLICLLGVFVALRIWPIRPPLRVVHANIQEGATLNPFLPIELTFNRAPQPKELVVDINPKIDLRITPVGSTPTVHIAPTANFDALTDYALTINTKPPFVLRFKTEEIASNAPGWNEAFQKETANYRAQFGAQDDALIAIRKSLPITNSTFGLTFNYKNSTYVFTIKKPYDQSKQGALKWFREQGVTDLTVLRIQWVEK